MPTEQHVVQLFHILFYNYNINRRRSRNKRKRREKNVNIEYTIIVLIFFFVRSSMERIECWCGYDTHFHAKFGLQCSAVQCSLHGLASWSQLLLLACAHLIRISCCTDAICIGSVDSVFGVTVQCTRVLLSSFSVSDRLHLRPYIFINV